MKKLLGLLFSFFFLSTLQAQSVDEILSKYFENIGGAEAWKKLESVKMTGTTSAQGMEFPMTVMRKRPNLTKIEVEVQGMQMVPQAYDGKVGWTLNPFMGSTDPTKLDEETTKELAKEEFEDVFIDYAAKGSKVELLGTEEIEGANTYKIKLTKKSGDEQIHFFDSENYVPIMVRTFAGAGPMKGQAVETYVSDYQEVEGLMMPMFMEIKSNGMTVMSTSLETVEFNSDLADDFFSFPGETTEEKMEEVEKEVEEMKTTTMENAEKTVEKEMMEKEEQMKAKDMEAKKMVKEEMKKGKKKEKKKKKKEKK